MATAQFTAFFNSILQIKVNSLLLNPTDFRQVAKQTTCNKTLQKHSKMSLPKRLKLENYQSSQSLHIHTQGNGYEFIIPKYIIIKDQTSPRLQCKIELAKYTTTKSYTLVSFRNFQQSMGYKMDMNKEYSLESTQNQLKTSNLDNH